MKSSKFKVQVPQKAKIIIDWKDKSYNYSKDKKNEIRSIISTRYKIPKENVSVNFTSTDVVDSNGKVKDLSTSIINNIQDPKFQIKLFNDYITDNKIENVDFEFIKIIDNQINSDIDYDIYDKYRKYEIDWIEWDNFLSYGENNRLELKNLNGLVLINGINIDKNGISNGNQNGKSSMSIHLISFLLFGVTQNSYTLKEIFNRYSNSSTFRVRGGLKIDGGDYIIDRIVTRNKKRTGEWGDASQTVKYYKVINSKEEELKEFDKNLKGQDSKETNKIIKEAIGNEKDFKMIISTNGEDLNDLINTGATDRGRMLAKWIGLLPLEEKSKIATKTFSDLSKKFKSNIYTKTDLENNNNELLEINKTLETKNIELSNKISKVDEKIELENKKKEKLLTDKAKIDEDILKLDITTLNKKLSDITNSGKTKNLELNGYKKEYETYKDITFSDEEYKKIIELDKDLSIKKIQNETESKRLTHLNDDLANKEYCPTCHRKYENVDNTPIIEANKIKIEDLKSNLVKLDLDFVKNRILKEKLEENKKVFDKKLKLQNLIEILPVQINSLRTEYKEQSDKLKKYNENKENIDFNNKIDIQISNINVQLKTYDVEKKLLTDDLNVNNFTIKNNQNKITENNSIIVELDEETKKIYNWNVYLDMVGKNGISKSILNKTLPLINSQLYDLLSDICDFDIEIRLNQKNEVSFYIVKEDNIEYSLSGGSGFEKTVSALALRTVLGNISTMPKPNFITLDEVLGTVAKENYDNIRLLYSKIEKNYQFIMHITHLEDVKDWHEHIITITKKDNISSLSIIKNKTDMNV